MGRVMKRRGFLRLAGAAALAPVVPALPSPQAAAAGYSRYMYGLAVFHAHTRAGLKAADLVTKMRVPLATAEAMMGEMTARGMLAPVLHTGVARSAALRPAMRADLKRAAKHVLDTETAPTQYRQNTDVIPTSQNPEMETKDG